VLAGYLFQAVFGRQSVANVMGWCAPVAALLLVFLDERAAS